MNKMFNEARYSLLYIFLLFFFSVLVCVPVQGNNIRINAPVKVSAGTGDTLVLEFPLQWDNSWRDEFNWDAAWVFLKYKVGSGDWKHVPLSFGGHSFNGSSGQPVHFDYMPGQTGSNTLGLFVYRSKSESGNTPEIICKLKCLKSALGGMTVEKFDTHEAFIRAQGVEMVYVPYGAYYLGDGSCDNRFAGASDGSSVLVDSEDAISTSTAIKLFTVSNGTVGAAQTIAAAYPKGYKGFYTMKYELSQEQYVAFLNTLSYAQQKERVPGLASMKEGDYIFGNRSQPSNRNGICIGVVSFNNQPVIFANNLTNDNKYAQDNDGKTVACNYLSPNDMLAYCSWSGLRPMSELEYEKACRPTYPDPVVAKSYAWNTATVPGRLSTVSNSGQRNEVSGSNNTNVNAGNMFGPVRCGLFATSASNQQAAGATFWGAMEMSGNLKELCYNIGAASTFNGTVLGDGTYNLTKWNNAIGNFGVRGGGFTSNDDLLRVSDRTEATGYFTALEQHDSTVTFRGVRSASGVNVVQGSLTVEMGGKEVTAVCPYDAFKVSASGAVRAETSDGRMISNLEFSYMWYMQEQGGVWSVIPGETRATLNYQNLVVKSTSASVNYLFRRKVICALGEAIVTSQPIKVTNPAITLTPASLATTLDLCDRPGSSLSATVVASVGTFSWNYEGREVSSKNSYRPRRKDFEPKSSAGAVVSVTCQYTVNGCLSDIATINITIAKDTLICPLTMQDRNGNSYDVLKINCQCWMAKNMNVSAGRYCNSNNPAYCAIYGGLYTRTQANVICPSGWKLPDNNDWNILLQNNGVECGFNALPGGAYGGGSYSQVGVYGWWWSATSPYYACYSAGWISGLQAYNHPSSAGFSVRCVKK